jgi:hypothetical protein
MSRQVEFTEIGLNDHVNVTISANGCPVHSVNVEISIASQHESGTVDMSYECVDGVLLDNQFNAALALIDAILVTHCSSVEMRQISGTLQLFR